MNMNVKIASLARAALLASFVSAALAQTPPATLPMPGSGVTPVAPGTLPTLPPAPTSAPTTAPGTTPTATVAPGTTAMPSSTTTQLGTYPYPTGAPNTANAVGPLPPVPAMNPQPGTRLLTFGSQMFSGRFGAVTYSGFNPGYQVAIGDSISVRLWGAVAYDAVQSVDAQGNIFIPNVGPIHVQGVRNGDLTRDVETQVKRTYRANVGVYATLLAAQPVKVYVTGFVRAPGLYPGLSSDSVLYYLDRAGGIDTERGSFLAVEILRNGQTRQKFDLYKFLLTGKIDEVQLHDGDTVVVSPRRSTIAVYGNVTNPYQFELAAQTIKARDLMALALPLPGTTHLSVTRNVGLEHRSFYYPIAQADDITLEAGDDVNFTQDVYPSSVLVRVTGAQMGERNFVLPLGAKIKDLMARLTPSPTANVESIQLYRSSVAAKQQESINNTLNALQTAALTARNATLSEAQTRQTESAMIMQYIERAKLIVPRGQVVLASRQDAENTLLADGDVINVPESTNLVAVSGEVQLPNTLVYRPGQSVNEYVALVGGYTQRADRTKVLVMRQNGSVAPSGAAPQPGDEIMVLPTIETKYIEVASGITSILYQLAIAANVLTGL
jgi:protein involved in polysaccharide export with SLBB domain